MAKRIVIFEYIIQFSHQNKLVDTRNIIDYGIKSGDEEYAAKLKVFLDIPRSLFQVQFADFREYLTSQRNLLGRFSELTTISFDNLLKQNQPKAEYVPPILPMSPYQTMKPHKSMELQCYAIDRRILMLMVPVMDPDILPS